LEDIIGGPVHGYRAASFSIVEESRWALDVIADEGFAYDSSIFPVVHDRYGMPRAALEPHQLVTASGRTLIEIPPAVLSLGGLRIPVAGGGYFRLYPYAVTRWAMRRINRAKRPVVVYLHPWELDTGQPRLNIGLVTKFRHYVNIARVGERLRRLLRDFRFEPIGRIAQRYSDSVNETDAPRDGNHVSLSGESRQ
jgi:polysaccharide deacetylase family protein (PEP-CTERM system associated)